MSRSYTVRGRTWCIGSGTVPGPRDVRESAATVRCGECGRGCVAVRRGGTIAHHAPPKPTADDGAWRDNDHVPVEEVFDTRVLNCCVRAGIKYVGEFRGKTERELLRVRGWGRKTIEAVRDALDEMELPPLRVGGDE